MKKQKGIAHLLLVSLMLSLSLLYAVAQVQLVFQRSIRLHNMISVRQNFWQAEAGLECVLSLVVAGQSSSLSPELCELPADLVLSAVQTGQIIKVSAQAQQTVLRRQILETVDENGETSWRWIKGSWFDE